MLQPSAITAHLCALVAGEGVSDLRAVVTAVLYDPLHLLVNKLHTAQAGLFQTLDLPLHKQLKRNLGHKQSRPRALTKAIKM